MTCTCCGTITNNLVARPYTHSGGLVCYPCHARMLGTSILKQETPLQLPLGFSLPGPKTLKPTVDESKGLAYLVTEARTFLNNQTQYTRIEFKFESNYIVVAKLKD